MLEQVWEAIRPPRPPELLDAIRYAFPRSVGDSFLARFSQVEDDRSQCRTCAPRAGYSFGCVPTLGHQPPSAFISDCPYFERVTQNVLAKDIRSVLLQQRPPASDAEIAGDELCALALERLHLRLVMTNESLVREREIRAVRNSASKSRPETRVGVQLHVVGERIVPFAHIPVRAAGPDAGPRLELVKAVFGPTREPELDPNVEMLRCSLGCARARVQMSRNPLRS